MDNTIYNFSHELEKKMREHPTLKNYTFSTYDKRTFFDPWKVLSSDEAERNDLKQHIRWIYRQAWFYESLHPYEHVVERLRELSHYYHIFICSAPSVENYGCENEKKSTLHRDFGWTDLHEQDLFKNVIFTRDKTMVKWDFLIDDKPTIEHGIYTPERKRIILDQPYNKDLSGPRINWLMSVEEIRNVLEEVG